MTVASAESGIVVLPDVSLCAIVRDEMKNPAGGIVDFVERTVPFVEEAVIVDTGSVDGTREELERLEAQYPNLRVYDHKFDGFAQSRNNSLTKVQTKKALVLDADERLTRDDFRELQSLIKAQVGNTIYSFRFLNISPNGVESEGSGHGRRLFDLLSGAKYSGTVWEQFFPGANGLLCTYTSSGVKIKHFVPSSTNMNKKSSEFYSRIVLFEGVPEDLPAPSECPSFGAWKKHTQQRVRNKYR